MESSSHGTPIIKVLSYCLQPQAHPSLLCLVMLHLGLSKSCCYLVGFFPVQLPKERL